MDEKIIIFDTTLRDGEQSPGASLTPQGKLEIAHQLASLGVDVIEAGFPISSPGDFESVKAVAKNVKGPIICGLARCMKKDIEAAGNSLKPAKRGRIHVFLATSKIHMQYKLKKPEDEIVQLAIEGVKYASRFTDDIEFSPEDASRSEREFLYRVIEEVIKAGATTINVPDTVGYAIPDEYGDLIKCIRNNVPNMNKAVISVHCHNDLGLAVANSIAAIQNGAGQVECTINGIGERAGNAALEEIVMAISVRRDLLNFQTGIKTKEIYKTSRLVSTLTGVPVQPNKAIVGHNAFAHESGIHQDGVLKKSLTYEIMAPQDVGFSGTKLVMGKHSGRHAFSERLKALGYTLKDEELNKAFEEFKVLADKKKEVFDEDLATIVEHEVGTGTVPEVYRLKSFHISSGSDEKPTANIGLSKKGKVLAAGSSGDGPVDACYKAVDKITGLKGKLSDYAIRSVTSGKDALGEVSIRVVIKDREISARGASTDIIEASIKAYLNAINKIIGKTEKAKGTKVEL
ncbi:MAG: 2-isopropylmalate synthase [Candidatus Omnitrophica bacterium]|nr:2-isopropylmalate synthase [Candidatus Omnitrophota bacterium]